MLDVQKEGQTPWAFAPKSKFISNSLPHKSVSSLAWLITTWLWLHLDFRYKIRYAQCTPTYFS